MIVLEKDFHTNAGNSSLDAFDEIRGVLFSGGKRTAEGYGMALPQNRYLARTPSLHNFTVECQMGRGTDPKDGFHFHLYFRYDENSVESGILDLIFYKNCWKGRIGFFKEEKIVFSGTEITWPGNADFSWDFEVRDQVCIFSGQEFAIPAEVPASGRIGFSHLRWEIQLETKWETKFDFTCIRKIKICSPEIQYKPVFSRKSWEMPQKVFDPMSRWIFSAEAESMGYAVRLHAEIEGGPVHYPQHGFFYTKHPGNEFIENPYFQIVHPDGTLEEKQYIYYGKIGLHEHWASIQPAIPAADTECPVKQDFYLKEIPAGCRLIFGFEKMRSEDRQYLSECGREMIVDPFSGKLLDARKLEHGEFHLAVNSGANKAICRMIPKTVYDYDRAYSFACNNHFFFEDEDCVFEISGDLPDDYCTLQEVSLRITLEDVFKESLNRVFDDKTAESEESVFPHLLSIKKSCNFGKLPCGVYHIRTELVMNGEILAAEHTAFESMSRTRKDLSAPERSGLPMIFSAQNDFESGANPFDPRGEGSCNSAHYTSVSGLQVYFVEERREWELLKLFGRRLFSWYLYRSTKDVDVLHHLEAARNSEYLAGQELDCRFHANDVTSYTAKHRKHLADFLNGKGDRAMAAEALELEKPLTMEYLETLLSKYGIEWPAYNASLRVSERNETVAKWIASGLNSDSFCNYSFAPYYVTQTGVAFTALRYGRDLRDPQHPDYSAFSLAEDYPQLCSYPMICGCFTIANLKLDMPDLRLIPEVYGISGIPLDPDTIANHLPDGAMSSEIYAKRFYDIKTRVCWFRDDRFHFWEDDGFHFRNPSEADFNQLLDTWHHIRQWTPVRPLRSMAIVGGAECILKHKPAAELKQIPSVGDFLDFYNTAEDFPAFVYLSTRLNGLPNGFSIRGCDLENLKPDEVSTLVLPPLDCFTKAEKNAIRKLYEAGVNLLCSECADGLEDLFGVAPCDPHPARRIGDETTNTKNNPVRWKPLTGTEILLRDQDNIPILTLHQSSAGAMAAFFTFAPTAFLRRGILFTMHPDSKILANAVSQIFQRMEFSSAEVTITKGRIDAFRDISGDLVVIAMEDAHPMPKRSITPLLTVKGDWRGCRIDSDAQYTIAVQNEEKTLIRIHLNPDEARFFRFSKCKNS